MKIIDKSEKEAKVGSIFVIDGGSINGYRHFVINSIEPLSVSYCVVNNLDITVEVHRLYEYSIEDLFKPSSFDGEPSFTIIGNLSEYEVYNLQIADVEEKVELVDNLSKSEANLTTLDSEKAIYFLLAIEYRKTFVEIDGLDQQRDGFTFDQWLDKQSLLKTL